MSKADQDGDDESSLSARFLTLCQDLNMDTETQDSAWESYTQISQNCTLEGDKLHWLVCALYVSCRKSVLPTADQQSVVQGNGISLSALLRPARLSLIDFFQKMKTWKDMARLSPDLCSRIKHLESNFHVSCIMFQKYKPIFNDIFVPVTSDALAKGHKTKRKRQFCNNVEIFKFCWTLFIRVKGNFPDIGDDLINSYHLLLCCLDLMFANALISKNSRDILNPNFSALPENYTSYQVPTEGVQCILKDLCEKHEGILLEASQIREHYWKPFVLELMKSRVLKGDPSTLLNFLTPSFFDGNMKSINQDYDQYVLTNGDLDERIFLGVDASEEIGTPSKQQPMLADDVDERDRSHLKRNLQANFNRANFVPQTPLTGRKYLVEKDPRITPVTSAAQSVSRLQALLQGRKGEPSQALISLFAECKENPQERVALCVKKLGDIFLSAYTKPTNERPHSQSTHEFAENRLHLAIVLFYKALETILSSEKKRQNSQGDLSGILQEEIFTKSLLACCLEIVIFSYNSQRIFPWILTAFSLSPFHFYKLIEPVIRGENDLPRAVVKHLNAIEENILEKLAWASCSPLNTILSSQNYRVPTNDDVSIPTGNGSTASSGVTPLSSPVVHRQIHRVTNGSTRILGSPGASLLQRFDSPLAGSAAKRNLFGHIPNDSNTATPTTSTSDATPISQGQVVSAFNIEGRTILVKQATSSQAAASVSTSVPSVHLTAPLSSTNTTASPAATAAAAAKESKLMSPARSKRVGSLGLFFRKFYYLASVRLKDLCKKLAMDRDTQTKIWTCFEYMIVNHVSLMFDRHLDQILMCSIYVICKATSQNATFLDIMRTYKTQPQSESSVYRHVLIKSVSEVTAEMPAEETNKETPAEPSSPQSQPTSTRTTRSQSAKRDSSGATKKSPKKEATGEAASASPAKIANASPAKAANASPAKIEKKLCEAVYGDLIHFYNKVFVHRVKHFALQFSGSKTNLNVPPLSPLPATRRHVQSPRKVSNRLELFISPIKTGSVDSYDSNMLYCFDQSPAKRLREINSMVGSSQPKQTMNHRRVLTLDRDADDCRASDAKRSRAEEVTLDRMSNSQSG